MTWKCVNSKGLRQEASVNATVFESGIILIWKIVVWSERRGGEKRRKNIKNSSSNFMVLIIKIFYHIIILIILSFYNIYIVL